MSFLGKIISRKNRYLEWAVVSRTMNGEEGMVTWFMDLSDDAQVVVVRYNGAE